MKPSQNPVVVLLALILAFLGPSLHAQVTNFSLFKVTVYYQSSSTPPATPDFPNAYYFGAQLNTLDSSNYADVTVTSPGNAPLEFLDQLSSSFYDFNSSYYSDKAAFDADFPSGEYDYVVDHLDSSQEFGDVVVPEEELYSTDIAAFTTNCWNAMQQVDPSACFQLDWNSFDPSPNTTSAFTFVDIYDPGNNFVYGADFLTPDTMTTNIPANTLQYGATYRVNTFFSSRQDTTDAGFDGALGTVGFDNLTYTTLVTIPPWLRIASQDQTNVVLTWSTLTTNFVLQATPQLAPGGWTTITNVPAVQATTNFLTIPANCPTRFFRLISADSL